MSKKQINKIILKFSAILLKIFVKFNLSYLSSLVLFINLRRVKKIYSSNFKKRIIILPKSGGLEDILSAYKNPDNNNDIGFYILPRHLIKIIFLNFLKNEDFGDFLTIDTNEQIKRKKENYKLFIKKTFIKLNKFWKFDALISFNPFYYAENDLPEPIKDIGKKFLIIHKESVHVQAVHMMTFKIYRDHNKKNLANKVAVYSENEKKKLVDTNLLESSQLEVVGCARSDYCFELREIQPKENKIIYYMIVPDRDQLFKKINKLPKEQTVEWFNLANLTIKYLVEYASKNPNVNIVFKGKWGVHSLNDLPENLPNNCSFEVQNPGHKYLKDSKVVICFNSTILFEAIMANREVIIPNFGIDRSKLNEFILKSPNKFADTKEYFFDMIDKDLNKPYKVKNFSEEEKECVDFYLGNSDGKAGIRLKKFIEGNI
ncbi:MAG: hypothetical protein ACJZ4B_02575 [Candidatus Pelagibacter sp.]